MPCHGHTTTRLLRKTECTPAVEARVSGAFYCDHGSLNSVRTSLPQVFGQCGRVTTDVLGWWCLTSSSGLAEVGWSRWALVRAYTPRGDRIRS